MDSWPGLDRAQIASFGRASHWKGGAHVGLEWALVAGVVAVSQTFNSHWTLVPAVLIIAARQHALAALAHEAAHGRLFPGRWNLLLAEILVAWPLLLSVRAYRRVHMAHHRFLSTSKDPDWVRNRPDLWQRAHAGPGGECLARVRHLAGFRTEQLDLASMFIGTAKSSEARPSPLGSAAQGTRHGLLRIGYYIAAALVITALHGWALLGLYWFLPLFTWFLVLMRVRGIAEHWAVADDGPLTQSRTLLLSPLARFLFLPKNMGYHLEHHLYPSVPFAALPELHRSLMGDPGYAKHARVTRGIRQLLREIAVGRGAQAGEHASHGL